ncbi:uncharacterized protein METZ01_LOCUS176622 [marine metagenome]|uniref:Uncharacterized protein n=1 Tax=marine metagenome TaxID=408172 RepID=A0A382CCB0_9ZZZZ
MTIHIYSDSFGVNYGSGTWPFELGKLRKQKTICYGKGGTGPNWSLKKLITNLEDPLLFKPQDTIIVLLSDQKRMEFPWLKEAHHADGMFLIAEENRSTKEKERKRHWGGEQYKIYKSEIKTVANTLGPMYLYENVKNITFLHLISKMFKDYKFLVFTCFSLDNFTSNYKNFNIESTKLLHDLTFEPLKSPNFYYCPVPISHMVGKNKDHESIHNHMTNEQNGNFALLCDAILNNKEPDISWFVPHTYYSIYSSGFIYE